jgi:hypothetical protein
MEGEYATMLFAMARRPDPTKHDDMMTAEDLKELRCSLAHLSEPAVLEVYQRAYRACRIINSHSFPTARAIQELVPAWKQLRNWR